MQNMEEDKNSNVDNKEEIKEDNKEEIKEVTTSPLLEATRKENDRREKLLEKEESIVKRKEQLEANRILGGGTEAGQEIKKEKEETDLEYTRRMERMAREGEI